MYNKLYFKYGTMNSSKTANLLMLAHNYKSQGKKIVLIKPDIDTRFSLDLISSRAVESVKANIILTPDIEHLEISKYTSCVLVDECQFLSERNIEALRKLTLICPVICFGLRTDYRSKLFKGSKRLMEIADTIEEIKNNCVYCNKKAVINAKFYYCNTEKIIISSGSSEPDLGTEEKYESVCWFCWNKKTDNIK